MTEILTAEQASGIGPEKSRPRPKEPRRGMGRWILRALRERGPLCTHQLADAIGKLPTDASARVGQLAKRDLVRRVGTCNCRTVEDDDHYCKFRFPSTIWAATSPPS